MRLFLTSTRVRWGHFTVAYRKKRLTCTTISCERRTASVPLTSTTTSITKILTIKQAFYLLHQRRRRTAKAAGRVPEGQGEERRKK